MANLPLPNLDDRRWVDLVQEGQALIPFYAPEWTDHNASDPGITLVELFAWLAEMDLYQLNRIPARHLRKFLSLIGVWLQPPQAARTVIAFNTSPIVVQPFPYLPASVEVETCDVFGQPVRFRTLDALHVMSSRLQAIQVKNTRGYQDLTARWLRGETLMPFGDDPQPGTALYLGFNQPLPPNTMVSLYFTLGGQWIQDNERQRLIEETEAAGHICKPADFLLTCNTELAASPALSSREQTPPHHSVMTIWEYQDEQLKWRRLDPSKGQIEDDTRSLTLSGQVKISVPGVMGKERRGQMDQELYSLRCRFISGAYEAAPQLRNLAVNAVQAEQAVTPANMTWSYPSKSGLLPEEIGMGTGTPFQSIETSEKPVLESTFQLFTLEDGELFPWKQQQDFDASRPNDWHFLLDASRGQVSFGDGKKGRTPPINVPIVAYYLTTRAEAGNLPVKLGFQLIDNNHNRTLLADFAQVEQQVAVITNTVPANGGAAAEELAHAEGRAYELAEEVDRAVTLDDIGRLARKTPGIRLARAWAQANHHPAFPAFQAPGVITLIILPYLPKDRPSPSLALQRRVNAYVSRRRVIGTRLEVIGPEYVEISVQTQVEPQRGIDPAVLRKEIETAISAFFHPLTGGPNGQGWPFGRDVYRSEVLQVIDETPGVDHVLSLEISANGGEPQCANICIGPAGLVAVGQHQIEIGGDHGV
jgi:predicted phage baseplate assembly protein